jgi:hypothetical protein
MDGFKDENEFRKWQAAVALQYGIEVPVTREERKRSTEWPKHPDEIREGANQKVAALA